MAFFSLYVIPYIGSKGINHVGKAIEESFNQQPYMCIWGRGGVIYNSVLQCILYSFKFKIFLALSSLFFPIFFNIYLNAIDYFNRSIVITK